MWEYSDEDKELDKYEGIPAQWACWCCNIREVWRGRHIGTRFMISILNITNCQTSEMKVQQAIEARGLDPRSSHSYTLDLHNVTADDGKPDKISRKGLEGKGADGRELIPGNPPLSWDRMNQGSYCPRRRAICQISLILWTPRRKRFGGKKVCGGRESCKTISKVTEIMRTEFLVRSWF